MPSPRAVLADLKKLKLDTKKAWSAVGVSGHLKGNPHPGSKKESLGEKAPESVADERIPENLTAVLDLPEKFVHAQEEPPLEPVTKSVVDVVEENQDLNDADNDLFRSKKKKKLTT